MSGFKDLTPLLRGVATFLGIGPSNSEAFETTCFVTTLFLSIFAYFCLSSSSATLSYFIFNVSIRKCLGQQSCGSSTFSTAILCSVVTLPPPTAADVTAVFSSDLTSPTAADVMAVFQSSAQLVQVEESLVDHFTICCSQLAIDRLPQMVQQTEGHANTGDTRVTGAGSTQVALAQLAQ